LAVELCNAAYMANNSMADRLTSLRKAQSDKLGRRLSAQEVADAVGISRSTLSGYERGHDNPGRDTLIALATYYGVPVDHLAFGTTLVEVADDLVHDRQEAALLSIWRRLDDGQRRAWLDLLSSMSRRDAA